MLAAEIIRALARRGETVAFCESLTAGLASATVADVSGASTVLRGGLITYATELKVDLANVSQELIDVHGVVSEEVAAAMATGTREVCNSTWAVSLTGVAGPDAQDGHPAGEVFIGCAGPDGTSVVRAVNDSSVYALTGDGGEHIQVLSGDRNAIRTQAVDCALELLLKRL